MSWRAELAVAIAIAGLAAPGQAQDLKCEARFADERALGFGWAARSRVPSFRPEVSIVGADCVTGCTLPLLVYAQAASVVHMLDAKDRARTSQEVATLIATNEGERHGFIDSYLEEARKLAPDCRHEAQFVGRRTFGAKEFVSVNYRAECRSGPYKIFKAYEYSAVDRGCSFRIGVRWNSDVAPGAADLNKADRVFGLVRFTP